MRYVFDIEDETFNEHIQDILNRSVDELKETSSSFASICLQKIADGDAGESISGSVELNALTFASMLLAVMAEIKRTGKKIAESN